MLIVNNCRLSSTAAPTYSANHLNFHFVSSAFAPFIVNTVSDALFNHSSVLLACHGLDTTAKVTLNGEELLPKPSNMFIRYRYDVKNKLITVISKRLFLIRFVIVVVCLLGLLTKKKNYSIYKESNENNNK